jgi:hypothetical protein
MVDFTNLTSNNDSIMLTSVAALTKDKCDVVI